MTLRPARWVVVAFAVTGCDRPAPPVPAAMDAARIAPPPIETAAPAPTASSAKEAPPTEVAAQHILVAYKGAKGAPKGVTRTKLAAETRAQEALDKIRGGADFTSLVKEYSDDPGSADRLGSVGKFTRDKMVKPFSDAAFALKVDQVSDVVESPFGFHVIKRNQ
jgi:hypothetical protein